MTNAEAIMLATTIQAEIDARITEGLIPPRPSIESGKHSTWFKEHVGCANHPYAVRERGSRVCHNCADPCVVQLPAGRSLFAQHVLSEAYGAQPAIVARKPRRAL